MTLFKTGYDEIEAFSVRGDLLRHSFGNWDFCDPVSHLLLDLAEAQTELSDLFEAEGLYGCSCEEAFKAAIEKRHTIARKLLAVLEDRKRWPDPDLGRS